MTPPFYLPVRNKPGYQIKLYPYGVGLTESWLYEIQKCWPCEDGIYEAPLRRSRAAVPYILKFLKRDADLEDPHTRAVIAIIAPFYVTIKNQRS